MAHVFTANDLRNIVAVRDDEQVRYVTRTHILFFIIKTILAFFIVVCITTIAMFIEVNLTYRPGVYLIWGIAYILLSFVILAYAVQLHNYYLSKQVITTYRIIDYDQRGLFKAEVNETFLENVENINTVQTSFWQTVFDFGNIDVQTAGQRSELSTSGVVFENVPSPKKITQVLTDLIQTTSEQGTKDILSK